MTHDVHVPEVLLVCVVYVCRILSCCNFASSFRRPASAHARRMAACRSRSLLAPLTSINWLHSFLPHGTAAQKNMTESVRPSCPSCRLLHHGAAASSAPHSIVWMRTRRELDLVAYPSHSILNLATFHGAGSCDGGGINGVPRVQTTLRTGTVPNPNLDPAAGDRIITAISRVEARATSTTSDSDATPSEDVLVCAFSDGTVTAWHRDETTSSADSDDGGNGWKETVVLGHLPGDSSDESSACLPPTSIADVAGIASSTSLAIVTASVDGINLHILPLSSFVADATTTTAATRTIKIGSHAAASVSVKVLPKQNELLIVSGTASPRGNRIHVYTVPLDILSLTSSGASTNDAKATDVVVHHHGSLPGHLDWVTCFAFWDCQEGKDNNDDGDDGGGFLLASGSHDARVRLWKFHSPAAATSTSAGTDTNSMDEDSSDGSDDESEADEDDLLDEGEARLRIQHGNGTETAVTLEALLVGHEEAVTSLSFRPRSSTMPSSASSSAPPCLMSSSMDRTILLWMEENSEEEDEMVVDGVAAAAVIGTGVGPGSQYRASAPPGASLVGPLARLCRDSSMPPSPPMGSASRDMDTVDHCIFGPPRAASMATRLNPNGGRPVLVSLATFEECQIFRGRCLEANICSVQASTRPVAFGLKFH